MFLLVVLLTSYLASTNCFKVYWNIPTQQCVRNYRHDFTKLLSAYGVIVNNDDKFQGNKITVFYEPQLGLYPRILRNGTLVNGGIPQSGDLSKHLERSTQDILNTIPDKNFNGVGVIDWESWRPSWNFNWKPLDIYRDKSRELVKKKNPSLDSKKTEELARSEFEEAAKSYMLETLLLAKKLRPFGRWGYYLFPDCYNYIGQRLESFECSKSVKMENNKLSWMWKSSTAVFPSIYLYESNLNDYSLDQRIWKDHGKLKEAMRVVSADAEVLPYVNHYLGKGKFVPQGEFRRKIAQVASIGSDGVVIWGSSNSVSTKILCNELKEYIIDTLGPAVERVAYNSNLCSQRVCNGNGFCTWPNETSVTAWKLFLDDKPTFYAGDVECRCRKKYTGRFCEKNNSIF